MTDPSSLHFGLAALTSSSLGEAWSFLQRGGIFMIPLGLTSLVGIMAILYKFLSLARGRVVPTELAAAISQYHAAPSPELFSQIQQVSRNGESSLSRLAAVVLKNAAKSRSEVTHAVESAARTEVLRLHAGIAVLDTIITIAPLLGLIGTASGLVTIFQGLGNSSDHLAIARGIAEALTTTIFGLAIAVPSVIAHGHFIRRIEMQTAELEGLLSDLTAATCASSRTSQD